MPRVFERLRGLFSPVVQTRREIFKRLAKLIFENKATQDEIEALPYTLIKARSDLLNRCCSFRERAIVRERVRLACGLDLVKG